MKHSLTAIITVFALVCNIVFAAETSVKAVEHSTEVETGNANAEFYENRFSSSGYAMSASLTYIDENGIALPSLNGAKRVNAAVAIKSEKAESKNAVLIFKAVNSNDNLYVSTSPVEIAANVTTQAEISLDGIENMTDKCPMSLFLWDNTNTLRPLTEKLTFGQMEQGVTVSVLSGTELADVKLLNTLVASMNAGEAVGYRWQVSRNGGASWTDIAGETSAEYIVSAAQAGAQVRCAATADGTEYFSETVQIPNYETIATNESITAGTVDTTPEANKFTVDGKGFILLDIFDNDASTYYVTTTDAYGDMQLQSDVNADNVENPTGKQISYDAYKSDAFLNGDFLTKGNNFTSLGKDTTTYYKLPQGIIDNINQNHVWWRFVNDTKKGTGVQSTYQTGVSFLSWTDFTTYAGKLGAMDVFNDANVKTDAANVYFIRDTHTWGGDSALALFGGTKHGKKCIFAGRYVEPYGLLRPAFYLKKSFFKTTRIDLPSMGENVKKAIRAACTDEDLLRLYDVADCKKYFGIQSAATLTTSVRSGAKLTDVKLLDTLTASVNGGTVTAYKWQKDEDGEWKDIEGATSAEYTVSAAEAGVKVRCTTTVDGNLICGEAVQIPNPEIETPTSVTLHTFSEETPNKFRFTVDGKGFVLLDAFDNDESTYYVTTTEAYGDMQTVTNGAAPVGKMVNYDAYQSDVFLNGDFLTKGNNFSALGVDTTTYYKLPQGIIDNINQNHVWWRFVNDYRKQNGVSGTYKAGVSLLSWTDFKVYAEKLGLQDAFNAAKVKSADVLFLRDTNNWGGNPAVTVFGTGKHENKCIYIENQAVNPFGLLRPAFYLKKDFFQTVKLDLSQTGDSVLAIMRGRYCIEDLTGIYTEQELTEYGFRRKGETNGDTLKIESVSTGNIFTDAEDAKIRINSSAPAICYRITDYNGEIVKSGTVNTVHDFAELNLNHLDVGYYEFAVQNGGTFDDNAEKKLTSFAIIPEFDFADVTDSPFGVNTHFELNWLGWDIKTISLLQKAGVKSVRDGYEWNSMESVKGEYKNYNFFPYEQARLRQAGIDYLYVAGSHNKFYDNGASPYTDEGIQGLANYAKKATELYNHYYGDYKLKYMEMYNEWYTPAGDKGDGPADSDPKNYIKVFKKMYETVKAEYSNMAMFLNLYPEEEHSEGLLSLGGLNYCDGYAIHHYNYLKEDKEDPENPERGLGTAIDKTRDMIAKYNTNNKDLKFWVSEFGWPSVSAPDWGVLITEKEQAEYLVRGFAIALSKGVERVYWYDFMNDRDRTNPNDDNSEQHKKNGEYNYGLIRNGLDQTYGSHTPKRSYVAYANLTRELANKKFVNLDKADDGVGTVYHYHFKGSNGRKTAIAYYAVLDGREEKPSKNVTITATESVVVKSIEGKVIGTASAGNDITLNLSSAPVYIEGGYTVKQ